jgi:hypothetical protein
MELESYITKLTEIYDHYNKNYSHRDLIGFIQLLAQEEIMKYFPNEQLLKDMIEFVKNNTETQSVTIEQVENTPTKLSDAPQ